MKIFIIKVRVDVWELIRKNSSLRPLRFPFWLLHVSSSLFLVVSFQSVSFVISWTHVSFFVSRIMSASWSIIENLQERRWDFAELVPSLFFSSFQYSAVFILHLSHSDISINRASSASFVELLLTSFLQAPFFLQRYDHDIVRLLCSATWACPTSHF